MNLQCRENYNWKRWVVVKIFLLREEIFFKLRIMILSSIFTSKPETRCSHKETFVQLYFFFFFFFALFCRDLKFSSEEQSHLWLYAFWSYHGKNLNPIFWQTSFEMTAGRNDNKNMKAPTTKYCIYVNL